MARVNIRYENGTTVDANNLSDAVVHLVVQGTNGVVDIVEEPEPAGPCKHCDGTGRAKTGDPSRVMTRKQIDTAVKRANDEAPPADASFDDRVKAARAAAKAS